MRVLCLVAVLCFASAAMVEKPLQNSKINWAAFKKASTVAGVTREMIDAYMLSPETLAKKGWTPETARKKAEYLYDHHEIFMMEKQGKFDEKQNSNINWAEVKASSNKASTVAGVTREIIDAYMLSPETLAKKGWTPEIARKKAEYYYDHHEMFMMDKEGKFDGKADKPVQAHKPMHQKVTHSGDGKTLLGPKRHGKTQGIQTELDQLHKPKQLKKDQKAAEEPKEEEDEQEEIFGVMTPEGAKENKPVVQRLKSDEGMAYYGTLMVGGQPQTSIYDTGSFDVVLTSSCSTKEEKLIAAAKKKDADESPFGTGGGSMSDIFGDMFGLSKKEKEGRGLPKDPKIMTCCPKDTCPHAGYSHRKSGMNYAEEKDLKLGQITYGSGTVITRHGTDHVQVEDTKAGSKVRIAAKNVPIEQIVDHEVELFKDTEMQGIIGIGPGAWKERKARLTSKLGIKRFTVCFQEDANEDGFMTWNDKDVTKDSEWVSVPVLGTLFWAVPTSEFRLSGTGPFNLFTSHVGCSPKCGGILDTGTSLITPPSDVVELIQKTIEDHGIDTCEDVSKFPTLHFKLGDHEFSLPPQSYIAESGVQEVFLNQNSHQYLQIPPLPLTKKDLQLVQQAKAEGKEGVSVGTCTLLLSPNDDTQPTQFGPMVIFGMSMFRKYSVQFDLSADLEDREHTSKKPTRMMHFAEAKADCSGTADSKSVKRFMRQGTKLQKVNLNKMRVSPLQRRVARPKAKGFSMFRKTTVIQI